VSRKPTLLCHAEFSCAVAIRFEGATVPVQPLHNPLGRIESRFRVAVRADNQAQFSSIVECPHSGYQFASCHANAIVSSWLAGEGIAI
jgi:hypothetical protein